MPQVTLNRITEHYDQETDFDTAVDITTYHIHERHFHLTIDGLDCELIVEKTTWKSSYYEANEETGNYGPDITLSDEPANVSYKEFLSAGTGFDDDAFSELIRDSYIPQRVKNHHPNRGEFSKAVQALTVNEPVTMVVPNSLYKRLSHFRFQQALTGIYEKYIPGYDRYVDFR